MDLSMRWLNDYVKADMPIKEFVADMTMSGSKVETYHKMSDPINNVVVAKVLKLERHPDSEKLWICQLDAGRDEPVQIVTAAQNAVRGGYSSRLYAQQYDRRRNKDHKGQAERRCK